MKNIDQRLVVVSQMPPPARRLLNIAQQLLRAGPKPARRAIQEGWVWVNQRQITRATVTLEVGDEVQIIRPAAIQRPDLAPTSGSATLVHLDEDLLVVEKPAGLLTVPTPYREKKTLLTEVQRLLQSKQLPNEVCCVHRLDREVSGLLVFARSVEIAERLRDQFAARKPRRRYTAIVQGEPQPLSGTFQSYLTTDDQLNRHSVASAEEGELAITHYQVESRVGGVAVVDVWLETGRRNQIRVHFSEAGYPLVGDRRYHGRLPPHPRWSFRRVALHARELGFVHPTTDQPVHYESPLPPEMTGFLHHLGRSNR